MRYEVDVAIVGAGGAGLNLAVELDRLAAVTGRPAPSVAVVDPAGGVVEDRTWCFWDDGPGDLEPAVTRSWRRLDLVDRSGHRHTLDLGPLRYVMITAADFSALAGACLDRLGAVRIAEPARAVTGRGGGPGTAGGGAGRGEGPGFGERPGTGGGTGFGAGSRIGGGPGIGDGGSRDAGAGAEVITDSARIRARWVFDSRPAPPGRPPRTAWLQHFRGWTVRTPTPVLAADRAVLMDFSVVQPADGLAFGYVLPTAADRALVEYTVFSRDRLPGPAYDDALRAYLGALGIPDARVEAVEDGAIPMTDAVHARRAGPGVFRLGTAGGATRGSTGYTFAAMNRQARAVAAALLAGREPVPPPAYPPRHRWMDAVLLRALDRGLVDGPDLFVRLFARNPPDRVLRFLDGLTGPAEDLALMATAPTLAMSRAAAADALARLRPPSPRRRTPG